MQKIQKDILPFGVGVLFFFAFFVRVSMRENGFIHHMSMGKIGNPVHISNEQD